MKILLFIIMLLSLCSCSNKDKVSQSIYIASIGFERTNEGITSYFLLPSSVNVGPQKNSSESSIAKIESDSITNSFNEFKKTSSLKINLKHISSIILHESMMNSNDLNSLIQFVNKSDIIDFNFYIFTTKENIEDIYKIKNPDNESMILTVIVEPIYTEYSYYTAKPIHYLNFCRDYYNNKTIHIPYVELQSIWGENDLISASGITFYDEGKLASISTNDNPALFLVSHKGFDYSDNKISVIFTNYKVGLDRKNTTIEITTDCDLLTNCSIDDVKKVIEQKIKILVRDYSYLDFLNFKYYGYTYDNVNINVNISMEKD